MLIQDVQKQHPPFHEPAGKAAYLIETGKFFAVQPEAKKATPNLQWAAQLGARVEDYECPPFVAHSCSTCGTKGYTESQVGTAHQSVTVRHCGVAERCPSDVAAKYVELFTAWKSRSRRPVKTAVSRFSPMHEIRAFGLKTREELIAEAVAATRK